MDGFFPEFLGRTYQSSVVVFSGFHGRTYQRSVDVFSKFDERTFNKSYTNGIYSDPHEGLLYQSYTDGLDRVLCLYGLLAETIRYV